MHPRALLEATTALLREVLAFELPADRIVADFFRAHASLGARDRRVAAETVYAIVRELPMWRHLAAAGGGDEARRLAILGWRGDEQLLQAALDEADRRWRDAALGIDRAGLPEALRHNLPAWLAERLQAALGDSFAAWVDAVAQPAPLDLRVNPLRASRKQVLARLAEDGIAAAPTPYSPLGIRVAGKPSLQAHAVFADGSVEVQDEGSQIVALALGARRGEIAVDYCAGAGGKTLALGAQMHDSGRLYAFDVSAHRLAALQPRLRRSGLGNVHPMQITGERDERLARLAGKADRVLVDAPCSGLGTLRRHPDLKWRQTAAALADLAATQAAVLEAAARLVKPGGRLVYATCSPLAEEDEAVAASFASRHGGEFERLAFAELLRRARVADAEALVEGENLRLWTHRHGTDEFFAAAWQRARSKPAALS